MDLAATRLCLCLVRADAGVDCAVLAGAEADSAGTGMGTGTGMEAGPAIIFETDMPTDGPVKAPGADTSPEGSTVVGPRAAADLDDPINLSKGTITDVTGCRASA